MRSLAALLSLVLPGCSCSVPLSSLPDAGTDAPLGVDAPITADAPLGTDAPPPVDAARADAPPPVDAGMTCMAPAGYPPSTMLSRPERGPVEDARAVLEAATGATIVLDDVTAAVTNITGGTVPVPLDTSITDPCERARTALVAFFDTNDVLFRMPADMYMRACHYDDLTDSEIVRLSQGTYSGRPLLGVGNDIVAHVSRSGTLRYFGGSYLPAGNVGLPSACLDSEGVRTAILGEDLRYTTFSLCRPGASGGIPITADDTRVPGPSSLYIDADGNLHLVRAVEVYLDDARVTPTEINSDLYCCPSASLVDCVGKTLIVDELTGEILEEIPNCTTC